MSQVRLTDEHVGEDARDRDECNHQHPGDARRRLAVGAEQRAHHERELEQPDGQVIVQHGRVVSVDEDEIRALGRQQAARLWQKL